MNLRRLIPPSFWRPQCNGSTDCLARASRLVQCLSWVDAVEKAFRGYQTKFSKAADAFCTQRREEVSSTDSPV